ncbi:MAG: ABC transporter substrate-binding protein [Actinomadura sp.]
MRVNGRRGLSTAVVAVLAGVLAATTACSGDNTDEGASGGQVQLTVDTFGEFGYEDLLKQYEASHPGVKITQRKVAQLDQYIPRMQQWIATGSGAGDVVALEEGILPTYMQQRGKFVNLLDHGAGSKEQNFLPWKWKMGLSPDGKQLVGLGTDIGPMGMCYRKDLFKKAGLPDARDEVSKLWPDWNAFLETGKKFQTAVPKTKFLDGPTAIWRTLVTQEGGKSTGYTYFDTSDKLVFDSNPAVKTAFDTTLRFQTEGLTSNMRIFTPEWQTALKRDTFATLPCPAWMLGGIEEFSGDFGKGKWDVAAVPGGSGTWGGSWLAVPKQSKHPKEAAELAQFLTSPEGQITAFKAKNTFPSSPAAQQDPSVSGKTNPYFGDAPIGKIFSDMSSAVKPIYLGPKNETVREDVEDILLGVGQGKIKEGDAWPQAVEAATKAAR